MSYIIKEKFNIYDLLPKVDGARIVAVIEPEYYLARLYEKHLSAHEFSVHRYGEGGGIGEFVLRLVPHALLLNPEIYPGSQHAVRSIAAIVRSLPRLRIVTIGYDTGTEDLKRYMSAGIAGHINRRLGRPEDIPEVVRAILRDNN